MAEPLLEITDLYITAEDGTEILNGVTLLINAGETHALMGPNGCGKSTLASTLSVSYTHLTLPTIYSV